MNISPRGNKKEVHPYFNVLLFFIEKIDFVLY
jgi:hypothetical protein